jgi:hypothetical protein
MDQILGDEGFEPRKVVEDKDVPLFEPALLPVKLDVDLKHLLQECQDPRRPVICFAADLKIGLCEHFLLPGSQK